MLPYSGRLCAIFVVSEVFHPPCRGNPRPIARHWPLFSPQNAKGRDTLSPWPASLARVAARSSSRGSRLPSRQTARPPPRPVRITPRSVYRHARSSVVPSPSGTANPAVSIQAISLRLARGMIVVVFGKGHARFADPVVYSAHTGTDEGFKRAEPRHAQPGQVDKGRQHGGEGRQLRGDRLPASGFQVIGAAVEREPRAVFSQHLQPHLRRGGIAQPEFENRHDPEIADRAVGRAVAAPAAAVEGLRGNA